MKLRRLFTLFLSLAATTTAGTTRAALPPRYDFALRVATEGAISTLDPCRARTRVERDLVTQLFEGLVTRTADGSRPALATDWSVSADSLTWTFQLDPRRTFGDGTPVRAAHVVASWQRAGREAPEWSWLFEGWVVRAPDTLTVRVTLRQRVGDFLDRLGLPPAFVVRETTDSGNRGLSGAGPFRFAGRGPDGFMLSPRLDDPRGRPFPGRILVRPVESASELKSLWQSGGAAIADGAPFGGKVFDGVALLRSAPTAWLLLVNPARPALNASAVRARLAGTIARAVLVGGLPGENLTALEHFEDIWSARRASVGKTPAGGDGPGAATTVTLVVDQSDRVAVSLGEDLVGPLAAAGLAAVPRPMVSAAWRQAIRTGDYDLLILRWDSPAARASLALPELLFRPEIARLGVAGASAATEPSARLLQLTEADILLPLVGRTETVIGRSDLIGLSLDPITGALRMADVWPAVRNQP